ncbi:DUF2461 domain-containing protein [Streptomyces albipurpureus]|uniref:DUF2461 domain-containing protein n=1 Tax=Streptomyces albipurpureus TaxID=2897419 RepID=A0ABT0UPF4_9ACTN|nr:DUF2461 domain-containing protein [Streptomyces sp. CWNU-1]MCM2389874.1 DUF2461 domain-containing protein [Streptomyces sp. CWNU-1]
MATDEGVQVTPPFDGFPPQLFAFLEGLEKDNSKTYWEANRATWEEYVKGPVNQLMADLEEEFGPLRTFRPHRDVRFSKDKSPYKTWVGVTTSDRAVGGIGAFLRIESDDMRLAGGAMAFAPDQVKRFRSAVADGRSAHEFEDIRRQLADRQLPVGPGVQPVLKRTPADYPADHHRAEILRWKGAVVIKEYERAEWMHRPQAIDTVREVWNAIMPLKEWIDEYVGESQDPPRRRGD